MIPARVPCVAVVCLLLGFATLSTAQDGFDDLLDSLNIPEEAAEQPAAQPAVDEADSGDALQDLFGDAWTNSPETAVASPAQAADEAAQPEMGVQEMQPAGEMEAEAAADPLADLMEQAQTPAEGYENLLPGLGDADDAAAEVTPAAAEPADDLLSIFAEPAAVEAQSEAAEPTMESTEPEMAVEEEGEDVVAEAEKVDDPARIAQEVANRREVVLRAREVSGLKSLEAGYTDLQGGRFSEAIAQFNRALRDIPVRAATDEDRARATRGLAEANFRIAERQWEAYVDTRSGEAFSDAIAKVDLALAQDPTHRAALRLKDRLTREMERGPRRQPVKEQQEVIAKASSVEELLLRGREYFEAGEYQTAENLFKQVLLIDETNRSAVRFLKRLADMKYAANTREMFMAKTDMMSDVRSKWNPPIRIPQEGGQGIQDGRLQPGVVPPSDLLEKKMASITIPSMQFRQANIQDVITFLVDASVAQDPDGVGINVILHLSAPGESQAAAPAAATPFADPFGADPFADPFGGGAAAPAPEAPAQMDAGSDANIPKITLSLRRVSFLDAIRYVTEVAGLKYRIEGNVVIVTTESTVIGTVQTKIYPVQPSFMDLVIEERENAGEDRTGAGGGEFIAIGARSTTMTRGDVREFFVKAGVPFPRGTSVVFNPSISSLIVANTSENLAIFERILSQINVIPPQIEIEARFIEVIQSDLKQVGLEWILNDNYEFLQKKGGGPFGSTETVQVDASSAGFTGANRFFSAGPTGVGANSRLGSTETPAFLGSILSISSVLTNPELQMVLHAIDQSGNVDVLSSPRVTTRNGVNAQIQVVREIIYPNEFTSQATGGDSINLVPVDFEGDFVGGQNIVIFPAAFETRETGVILNVTPTVGPDGYTIELTLAPEVAELVDWIQYGTPPFNIPQPVFASRKVTTSINIWDGQTVVMGGLIKEDLTTIRDKIPLLGDIPLIGRLFRTDGERSKKENLLIFVTARIVDPAGNPIRQTRDLGNLSFLQQDAQPQE